MKLAGRDAGQICIVIKKVDSTFVMIDGQTRRRKCNIKHLEPLDKTFDVNDDATHDEIKEIFKKMNIELKDKKSKNTKPRQKKQHKQKEKPVKKEATPKKKTEANKKPKATVKKDSASKPVISKPKSEVTSDTKSTVDKKD